ncbi:hypothetical protein ATCVBr0604L_415L [Acanthocystis turfacea Chlorella virus Br0604L]|nr:hypothetical protein ATCVBr0604L_415L [Acanthocystis turfacea Chlorella virus Br0604L]
MPRECQCGKRSSFGIFYGKPTHCKNCKTPDMRDVVNTTCLCGKRPYFGLLAGKPTHCSTCKTPDMINVVSKSCACGKRAGFGIIAGKPTHCSTCKTPDLRDVVHKRCPCGNRPSFGLVDGKPTHCKTCKTSNMKDVVSRKCQCAKQPSFGFEIGKPTHCTECKTDDMINVISKRCPGYSGNECPTNYMLAPGRDYCLSCDPDESRRLDRKRDEAAFFHFLLSNNIDVTTREFTIDYRCINTDKMRAHIDGIIITNDIVICLELDEDAHSSYDKKCEEARMHNVSAELRLAYPDHCIAWVRVNPHIVKHGKREVSRKATQVRNRRHQESVSLINSILNEPRDCIEYIGYK